MSDQSVAPAELLAQMPFAVASGGVELSEARPEVVRGSLGWSAERCTAGGILHGAALMTLTDTVGAVFGYLNLPEGAGTATIDRRPTSSVGGSPVARSTPRRSRSMSAGL